MSKSHFVVFAEKTAKWSGSSTAFILAFSTVVVWGLLGPIFDYSDTWQLVINTGTTIVTFMMVFLIQNTQNRDTRAIQLKLDELLRATPGAHITLIDLEDLTEDELCDIHEQYVALAEAARKRMKKGGTDGNTPQIKPRRKNPEK